METLPAPLSQDEARRLFPEALLEWLGVDAEGLTSPEAAARLRRYGPNALPHRRRSALLHFLRYFWGPIPWMIEVAALLSLVVHHWVDLSVVLLLLLINATIGFWEEHQAQGAVDRLQQHLAPTARVRRDGAWTEIPAREVVPGESSRSCRLAATWWG